MEDGDSLPVSDSSETLIWLTSKREEEAGRCRRKSVCPGVCPRVSWRETVWGSDLQSGKICAKLGHFGLLEGLLKSCLRFNLKSRPGFGGPTLSGRLDLRSPLIVAPSAGGLLLSKAPTVCARSHLQVSPNVWKQTACGEWSLPKRPLTWNPPELKACWRSSSQHGNTHSCVFLLVGF